MRPIDADALAAKYMEKPPDYYHTSQIVGEITAAPTVDDWISVKDRLPEDGQFVVVRHEVEGRIYSEVAHYILNLWWLDWDSNGLELNAISWIPLPEPPEVTRDG